MRGTLQVLALILAVAPAAAQMKDLSGVDPGPGPSTSNPPRGVNCSSPSLPIPDDDPGGATDTMTISDTTTIDDLTVYIQATHTWVGDLRFRLTHDDTGTTALLIDQPGNTTSPWGCSGDDIEVYLNDAFHPSVEDICRAAVPTIYGEASPHPDALGIFSGESIGGNWTMLASDVIGDYTGTLDTWCVDQGSGTGGDGDGSAATPATSPWGVIALIALLLLASVRFLRRRSGPNSVP